jgi:hypothetical protein
MERAAGVGIGDWQEGETQFMALIRHGLSSSTFLDRIWPTDRDQDATSDRQL